MASTTAYQCDGPECEELTTKAAGTRFPEQWDRLTLHAKGDSPTVSGSFHAPECATRWLREQLGYEPDDA